MTVPQIKEIVGYFAEGARRAREAGLDGVELHGANGYLFTQFLSSAINDRKDEYGGSLENRARFVLEVVRAIRAKVGNDFHLQIKISAQEFDDALSLFNIGPSGNTLADSVQVCKWLEEAGVDAIHVSTGSFFPHPRNPCGADLPVEDLAKTYDPMISSGESTLRNFLLFNGASGQIARRAWNEAAGPPDQIEGKNLPDSRAIKQAVTIPVICTGGFQTASVIRKAIERGDCDAVSVARTLIANNDLVEIFRRGQDRADKPCTYCNKCLVNVIENPLGCYDETRFPSRDAMVAQIMSVFDPPPFVASRRRMTPPCQASPTKPSRRTRRPSPPGSSRSSRPPRRSGTGAAPGSVSTRRARRPASMPSSRCSTACPPSTASDCSRRRAPTSAGSGSPTPRHSPTRTRTLAAWRSRCSTSPART